MNSIRDDVTCGVSLGSQHWSICQIRQGVSAGFIGQGRSYTAPSVLVPRFPGEPLRLDSSYPSHPRGSGEDWPPESRLAPNLGSGRIPMALAWTGRKNASIWKWQIDASEKEIGCMDAIAAAYQQILTRYTKDRPTALVIPNDLQQREQQQILDTCRAFGLNVSLIWLPVAAALAWLDSRNGDVSVIHDSKKRELVVIHADWGSIHCTRLQLANWTSDNSERLLPARMRPKVSDISLPGFGWNLLASCGEQDIQRVWKNLFVSPIVDQLAIEPEPTFEGRNVLNRMTSWAVSSGSIQSCLGKLSHFLRKSCESFSAVIIVGDFADAMTTGADWARVRQMILRNAPNCKIAVSAGSAGEALLSKGAAIHASAVAQGFVSYLDTLPELELFIDRVEHYEWLKLLGTGDQFVEGGKEWKLEPPVQVLAVPRGATRVKLVVSHEEYHGVRELTANLQSSVEQRLPVKLHVSCTPAQGNATLRVVTDPISGLESTSILANWAHMEIKRDVEGKELDKNSYLNSQPRAFPELRPRPANLMRWRAFEHRIDHFLDRVESSTDVGKNFRSLSRLLDSARVSCGQSAVSSEGKAPVCDLQPKVDRIAALLFDFASRDSVAQYRAKSDAIKLLAFISANREGMEHWIHRRLESAPSLDEPLCMLVGNCSRAPTTAALFIRRLLTEIPGSNLGRLLNYQMQGLGRLLSQRSDAMSEVSEPEACQLVSECLRVFSHEISVDKLAWLFEHSGLVVVYALRYRIRRSNFLDPDSQQAIHAKELFKTAIERLKSGRRAMSSTRAQRLSNGLQQLIDYIDKRGTGDILIARDEDE